MGCQHNSCGRHSGFAGTSAWLFLVQSKLAPLLVDVWSSGKAGSPIQLIEGGTQEGSQTGDSQAGKHHES